MMLANPVPTPTPAYTIYEEVKCKVENDVETCWTHFKVELIEVDGLIGLLIHYQNKTVYVPPIVGTTFVVLPMKYRKPLRQLAKLYPEILFAPRGRTEAIVI